MPGLRDERVEDILVAIVTMSLAVERTALRAGIDTVRDWRPTASRYSAR